jgi:hypothetical protein
MHWPARYHVDLGRRGQLVLNPGRFVAFGQNDEREDSSKKGWAAAFHEQLSFK